MRKTELIKEICELNRLTRQIVELEMSNYSISSRVYENITRELWEWIIDMIKVNAEKLIEYRKEFEQKFRKINEAIIKLEID